MRDLQVHLGKKYHIEAVKAAKVKNMTVPEKTEAVPLYKSIMKANLQLAKSLGRKLIDVYCDAKKGLAAQNWPARFVASELGKNFDPTASHCEYDPTPSLLTYVNPKAHRDFLHAIVDTEKPALNKQIMCSVAASIRVDGSVDRRQEDNKHVLLKFVASDGTEHTVFLGV